MSTQTGKQASSCHDGQPFDQYDYLTVSAVLDQSEVDVTNSYRRLSALAGTMGEAV